MSANDALIDALHSVCRISGTPPEVTRKIVMAAKGDPMTPDKTITTKQAADMLECCTKSVYRYAGRGLLHPVRRSARCIRWRKSEVERLAMQGAGQ